MSNSPKIFESANTIEKLFYFLALAHSFIGLINTCDMKSLSFSAHITFWTMGGHFENENRDCNDELWDAMIHVYQLSTFEILLVCGQWPPRCVQ